ncbi:MAG: DUF4445 domain-containing protein [Syntrophomonadaceae bacterium]|mgnify:CR=1 FL=1|nr:DUF4445 domain-containing protein [Syntrophomonadaceae bacterium]
MSDKAALTIINIEQKEYTVWAFKGQTLYDALLLHHIEQAGYCGGLGTCGKCKLIAKGELNELTLTEKEKLLPEELKQGMRLACQAIIEGSVSVYLDNYNFDSDYIMQYGIPNNLEVGEVKIHNFFISGLDKNYPVPIYTRIKEALAAYEVALSPENINELLSIDRAGRPSLKLYCPVFDNKTINYVGRTMEGVYGVAFDIGSTSLFAALVNLIDGQVVAVSSKPNMQRIYGADIVSRLSYALDEESKENSLHQILINNLNSMIEEMTSALEVAPRQVYAYSVVGNPVMLHFFTRISVQGFANYPYLAAFREELSILAKDIGLSGHSAAVVNVLPQIGGFVGADTTAALLNLAEVKSSYLLIDIGTNGEIVLHKDGEMWATSTAAGPAFEGGQISSGMRASPGSIDKVFLDENKVFNFNIIGQEEPVRGLCGSGIIDLVASLFEVNYIDKNGIIQEKEEMQFKILHNGVEKQLVIYDEEDILPGQPILFTQEDIRQIQLAKSAIRTGIDLLLERAKVTYEELDNIYLAGAFGNYLNPVSSITIGLLPPIEPSKVVNIGNAAGNGAILALISSANRELAKNITENINYVELANNPDFQARFLENLNF